MPSLVSSVLDFLFPLRCLFCDSISRDLSCPECSDSVKFISQPQCNICGTPFKSSAVRNHTCGECIKRRHHFSWARAVLLYNDASAKAIHRFKYNHDSTYSRGLGTLILDHFDAGCFDIIIPVPLHIKRLRERGFNQSLLLARFVGRKHGIPVNPFALKRIRWTEPQVNLSGAARKTNVKGAFEANGDVKGKRILLVDDVYTTGATVNECSRVLNKKGAKEVCVLTLARAGTL